jgi:ferritin-like metal-binding protein YciE
MHAGVMTAAVAARPGEPSIPARPVMELDTLEELYVEELRDLWSAENQILKALPKMIKAAGHRELKRAFTDHERVTRQQVRRLERIFKQLGKSPRGKKCVGMEGLLQEGSELMKKKPEQDVLDAGLIAAAQHVEHYEMAGYGTVRTWAQVLGREDHAELLQQSLEEEKEADRLLTEIAEGSINVEAEDEVTTGF